MERELLQKVGYPLSHEQQKIWFQYCLLPTLPVYNVAEIFHVRGALDTGLFVRALGVVVARHDGLMVRFDDQDGVVLQVSEHDGIDPERIVRFHPDVASQEAAVALIGECSLQPFDLRTQLAIRVDIARITLDDHVIGFCIHHIVYDGWSSTVFFDELNTVYRDLGDGRDPPLLDAATSYRDYVRWQNEPEQRDDVAAHNRYWQAYLQGVTPRLELALSPRREKAFNYLGRCQVLAIPDVVHRAADAVARRHRVTSFSLFMTVFSILLARYSRQSDFCIGYPSSNRGMPDAETIIGMFTNTLVHRVRLQAGDRFADALAATHETLIDAQANERVQLEKIIEALGITRDAANNPLFQVILAAQDRRGGGLQLRGTSVEQLMNPITTAKLDLSVMIDVDDAGARGIVEYATSVFEADEIDRLWGHYLQLLREFTENPEQAIGRPALHELGQHAPRYAQLDEPPEVTLLHHWFERVARACPEAIAVESGDQTLTYAELDERASRLSRRLLQSGAQPGDLVGLSLPRTTELIVAILAILKSGCGYLPLDPGYPADRLSYMIEDAGCKLVIVPDTASTSISAGQARFVALNQDAAADAGPQRQVAEGDVDAIAYCIYTSGSTGRPKGVLVSHRNVARLFASTQHWFGFGRSDVWTMFHSYSFDFSVWEIFGALLYGGRLLILPYEITRSPHDLRRVLKEKRVTVLNQTPSAFHQLGHVEMSECGPDDRLEALRYIIFGGEALNLQSLASWASRYGDDCPRLINMYGITETTVHVTYRRIRLSDIERQTGSLIGEPIPDLSLHLLDEASNPVPTGVVGEIYVGGAGVALGYHRRDQLNRERFVSWTAPDGRPHRLYKTGDLARRHADGELEYIGRIDHQVKVRGHRIEIGEIETQLLQQRGVAQAVVLVKPGGQNLETLVAWVIGKPGEGVDGMRLRRALASVLPAFMIPHDIVVIDRMPLTQNGKLASAELLAMATSGRRPEQAHAAAETPLQRQILAAWQQVLGIDRISIHDNFFAVGGDSIRAVMIAQACKKQGLQIGVIDLLDHRTIFELAEQTAHRAMNAPAISGAPPVSGTAPPARAELFARLGIQHPVYPVSGMQATMFEHYRLHAGDGHGIYHVQQSYRFADDHPDHGAMERAVVGLVAAHPVLRTVALRTDDGEWLQCTLPEIAVPFSVHDLRAIAPEERERQVSAFIASDRCKPFAHNDQASALLRFAWLRLTDTDYELFMSIHHGVDDGWGNQIFLSQLFELYLSARTGAAAAVAPRNHVSLEYIALEQLNARDPEHAAFWAARAAMGSGGRRARIQPQPAGFNPPVECTLDRHIASRLDQIARRRQVTLRALLVTALQDALQDLPDPPSQVIGVVMNGRKESLSDPLHSLGLFWNMLPLAGRGGNFEERLLANHRELLEMEKYSAYPSERTGVLDGARHEPEVTFNYVNFHNHTAYGGGALRLLKEYNHDRFHYPLNVFASFENVSSELYLKLESDAGYYTLELAGYILRAYAAGLTALATALPEAQVA
jgi:amino acid adenylation domain-containing protein